MPCAKSRCMIFFQSMGTTEGFIRQGVTCADQNFGKLCIGQSWREVRREYPLERRWWETLGRVWGNKEQRIVVGGSELKQ